MGETNGTSKSSERKRDSQSLAVHSKQEAFSEKSLYVLDDYELWDASW
jgi:hypothetical protein